MRDYLLMPSLSYIRIFLPRNNAMLLTMNFLLNEAMSFPDTDRLPSTRMQTDAAAMRLL